MIQVAKLTGQQRCNSCGLLFRANHRIPALVLEHKWPDGKAYRTTHHLGCGRIKLEHHWREVEARSDGSL